jgi:PAS domain S-box-containing protein
LRWKWAAVTALPALAVVATSLSVLATTRQLQKQDERAQQVLAAEQAVTELQTLVLDVETGVRGYVASGDRRFLEPELRARELLPEVLDRVTTMLQQFPEGGVTAGGLRTLVLRDLDELTALRDLGRGAADAPELVTAALVREKATTDQLRETVTGLRTRGEQLYRQSTAQDQGNVRAAAHRTLLLSGAGLLGGVGSAGLLASRLVRRVRYVERNAVRLAAGEPLTRSLPLGSDEVASLALALEDAAALISDQRQRLQVALEVGRINVWEVDVDGRMTMQGDRAGEYGATMESGLATLRPEHASAVRQAVAAVRADRQPRDYEVQNGEDARWFAGRVMPSSETDVIAVSVDVTALRKAQEELRESEVRRVREALAASEERGRHNALMLGSTREGIVSLNAEGVCTSANPAAAGLLGCEVADLVGRELHTLCHYSRADGTPYPSEQCPIARAARTGEAVRVDNEVFWRSDGTRLPIVYSVSPLGQGRGGAVVTFTDLSAQGKAAADAERLAASLRTALRADQLVLHYQPKLELLTGECRAVEALVRWQNEGRLVPPDEFIGVAERCGVITELTEWVIDAAAAQVAAWARDGVELKVAVNLSALSLTDSRIADSFERAAARHGIAPHRLEAEITESAAAEHPGAVIEVLSRLAALGIRTALDDFGTGFSSLSYLKHLPVSTLKIDKSFVMNMPSDPRDQAIVASTVHMAHSLGLSVVAEGVENEQVLGMLHRARCDTGQGYHWSRPLPAPDLTAWLRAHQAATTTRQPSPVR